MARTKEKKMIQPSIKGANDGQVPAEDAANYLGCSYSHIINLIGKKKLKAQKRGRQWMVEEKDLQHAKATNMVKPRGKMNPDGGFIRAQTATVGNLPNSVELRIQVPREKFELVKLAFARKDKTLVDFINEKIDALYDQIQERMKNLEL